jgi:hypothetical protein
VSRTESWVWVRRLDANGRVKSTAEISWWVRPLPVFIDPGADTWSAAVDWGDGTIASSPDLPTTSFPIAHVYGSAGTYTVTVTVPDKDGSTGVGSFHVTVSAQPVTVADTCRATGSWIPARRGPSSRWRRR